MGRATELGVAAGTKAAEFLTIQPKTVTKQPPEELVLIARKRFDELAATALELEPRFVEIKAALERMKKDGSGHLRVASLAAETSAAYKKLDEDIWYAVYSAASSASTVFKELPTFGGLSKDSEDIGEWQRAHQRVADAKAYLQRLRDGAFTVLHLNDTFNGSWKKKAAP
jgi:hypothetical protein